MMRLSGLLFLSLLMGSALEEVDKIQQAYKGISDIKGTFIQKSYIKELEKTRIDKGVFFIKRPLKMKWSYKGKGQIVVINNDEIIVYEKTKKQAFKGNFDRQTYGQAPVALLGGLADIEGEFDITKKGGFLILKPRQGMGSISFIELKPSEKDFPIAGLKITDIYSNTIELSFNNVELNTGLAEEMFKLTLPEGTEIYEHNP